MALEPSNAARSQAYITRARIGFVVYARILVWLIIVWAVLTVGVVWHETGQYFPQFGHRYFGRWAIFSTLVRTPIPGPLAFYHLIPTDGRRWSMAELAAWLNPKNTIEVG